MTRALRVPELEWAHRSGQNSLSTFGWIDAQLDETLTEYAQSTDEGPEPTFRHRQYVAALPPSVARAAITSQQLGLVTGWEVLQLLFARSEFLVSGRRYLWSAQSPVPARLSWLAATFGVEPALHRFQPTRLTRLVGLLPVWHRHRGTVARAIEVLAACDQETAFGQWATRDVHGPRPESPAIGDEVFAARSASWWIARRQGEAAGAYKISGGYLRFQPEGDCGFELLREDALIAWRPGQPLPHDALRVLPAWCSLRLVAPVTGPPASNPAGKSATAEPAPVLMAVVEDGAATDNGRT
jgi:hypothetical protein